MKNRTWILLRGLGREAGHWGPFAETFRSRFPGDEVVLLDLPGAGEFRAQQSPSSIHEIYQFVRGKAVERSPARTPFTLVAISLGGMVALEWMRHKPEDLAGCVLINTSSRALSPGFRRLRWQIWRAFLGLFLIPSPREREKALLNILINSEAAREKALSLYHRLAVEHPIRYTNITQQLWAASRFKDLPQSQVPALILCGLGDRLVDPSCSIRLHEKMSWPIEKHPWGGHELTWDDPEWVLQKVYFWSKASRVL